MEKSDEEESSKGHFEGMTTAQRRKKLLNMWKTVYNKTNAVATILRLKAIVSTKISLFGRQLLAEQLNSRTISTDIKRSACIIMPAS